MESRAESAVKVEIYFAVRQIQMNWYLTHLRSLYPTLEKQILDLQTETK